MSGLVLVEPGELDRGQDLSGLHRRAAHRRKLIDQRVDRRHQPVAATASLILVGAAAVDAIAGPANGPARGNPPEAQRTGGTPSSRVALVRHNPSLAAVISADCERSPQ